MHNLSFNNIHTTTCLYTFPYIVKTIIPWAPPWAPVCLWYAFLTQASYRVMPTLRACGAVVKKPRRITRLLFLCSFRVCVYLHSCYAPDRVDLP